MKDIRYSSRGIMVLLVLLTVLTGLMGYFAPLNMAFEGEENFIVRRNLYELVDLSLYGRNMDGAYDGAMNYFIKSQKITNYPLTQDYYRRFGQRVALDPYWNGSSDFNRYVYLDDEFDDEEASSYFINNFRNPEEPELVYRYLTNDRAFKREFGRDFKFEPGTIKIREGIPYVQGTYQDGGVRILEEAQDLDSNYKANMMTDLVEVVQDVYSNIDAKQGIERIDFFYYINPDSAGFSYMVDSRVQGINILKNGMLASLTGLLIIGILALMTSHEGTGELAFYRTLYRFPILVVGVLSLILIVISGELYYSLNYTDDYIRFRNLLYLFFAGQVFFGGLALLYLVQAIKSIYQEGRESFVVRTSLSLRVFRLVRRIYLKIFGQLNITDRPYLILVFVGALGLGYMGAILLVPFHTFLAMVLWTVLVCGLAWYLKKLYLDLRLIEDKTQEVARGNFETLLDLEENKFKLLAQNLNSMSENLSRAIEEAIKSEKMRTELITNVSHDLKTPLTSIINYSELLEDEEDPDKIRDYSRIINDKSHKLKVLIEDLFQVSKLSSGNAKINLESLNLYQLVGQVLGEWEDKLSERGLVTVFNSTSKDLVLDLDGHQFSRVLDNVFSNVYKYSMEGTRVYVDLDLGDRLVLSIKNISNYPLNISPEELTQRFVRGDESRTTEGSGLGLSIASSLVQLQNGYFDIFIDGDLFKLEISFDSSKLK